jgi:membrane-associated phospholipid phosphatase
MTNTVREARLAERRGVTTTPEAAPEQGERWWRVPPVDRRGLALWLAAYAAMTAVVIAIGLLIVHELGRVQSFDDRAARWFGRHRSDTWDALTWCGSIIADAYVKIPATAVLCLLFLWRWRRWTEPVLLAGALILEVAVFTTSSVVVDRGRPPIEHLDPIPPTGSFPSGHSAAAVAFYGAIAIAVCWHTRRRLARVMAIAAAVVIPLLVGVSRMYRGMHHFSDVAVGLVIGAVSLWVTWLVVRNGPAAQASRSNNTGAGADEI